MTGYGRGNALSNGTTVNVEISAVNRKQQDIRVVLPRELAALEPGLRLYIQERVSRGCVSVYLTYELGSQMKLNQPRVDVELAVHVSKILKTVASEAGLAPHVSLSDILAVPGVLIDEQTHLPYHEIEELARTALEQALFGMEKMRIEEGAVLRQDLLQRLHLIEQTADSIRDDADQAVLRYRQKLVERLRQLGIEISADDERLAKEIVFFAERSDITEEIVRLMSHTGQAKDLLNADTDAGRTLEFLCQEMNREVNTVAAKTSELSIANAALRLKTELSRIKEQVMNIE